MLKHFIMVLFYKVCKYRLKVAKGKGFQSSKIMQGDFL